MGIDLQTWYQGMNGYLGHETGKKCTFGLIFKTTKMETFYPNFGRIIQNNYLNEWI